MTNKPINTNSKSFFSWIFAFYLAFGIWHLAFPSHVVAQELSLSITPPIIELTIAPGKEYKQTYQITNNGGSNIQVAPKVVYFVPNGNKGDVSLTENEAPSWVRYSKDVISLSTGQKFDFNVFFSPPDNVLSSDHFLTLTFTSVDPLNDGQNAASYQSQIGSNILLTISGDGNPTKSGEIIKFSAPKFADSLFTKIKYEITVKNTGDSYWKPNGKITTEGQTLVIAPQTVLPGYTRNLNCIDNEVLFECNLSKKPFLGKVVSRIEFNLDQEAKIYKAEGTTYIAPFSLIFATAIVLTLLRFNIIFKLWVKRK